MTKHKLLAAAVAVAAIATLSVGASAESRGAVNLGHNYSFSFNGYGGSAFSTGVTKDNSKTYAEYVVSGGSVSDNAYVTLVVTSEKNISSTVSDSVKITVINGTATNALNYNNPAPGNGSTNYMCGLGSYYGASVSGTWNP